MAELLRTLLLGLFPPCYSLAGKDEIRFVETTANLRAYRSPA